MATHFAKLEHARDYGEARALPADTLPQWRSIIVSLIPGAGVHTVLDLGVVAVDPAWSWSMLARREVDTRPTVRLVAGLAEALPLRTAGMDLAFLSMVYHHPVDVPTALAELRRVVRGGGWVITRTSTREIVEALELYEFFPEARELDRGRMPLRHEVGEAFGRAGFVLQAHTTVRQRFADNPEDWLRKIALRGLSSLQLLPEDLAEFARHCRAAPPAPVWEPVDVFACQAP